MFSPLTFKEVVRARTKILAMEKTPKVRYGSTYEITNIRKIQGSRFRGTYCWIVTLHRTSIVLRLVTTGLPKRGKK